MNSRRHLAVILAVLITSSCRSNPGISAKQPAPAPPPISTPSTLIVAALNRLSVDPRNNERHPSIAEFTRAAGETPAIRSLLHAASTLPPDIHRFAIVERIALDIGYEDSPVRAYTWSQEWASSHMQASVLLLYERPEGIGYLSTFRTSDENANPLFFPAYPGMHSGFCISALLHDQRRRDVDEIRAAFRDVLSIKRPGFDRIYEASSYDATRIDRVIFWDGIAMSTVVAVNEDDLIGKEMSMWRLGSLWNDLFWASMKN